MAGIDEYSWDKTMENIVKLVLEDARNLREGAGYSGSHGDGGASLLEAQAEFFNYGIRKEVPPQWKKYKDKLDPEYKEYERLRAKFE